MSVARITEISSSSKESFQDAIEQGVARAAETLHGICSAWVKEEESLLFSINSQLEISKILSVISSALTD